MTGFRRMRKGDPNPMHFSPTEMAKCPYLLTNKKEHKVSFVYTDKVKEIFKRGSEIHTLEGIYREGAKGLINTELHMTVIKKDETMIFSGYMDFLMIDENGLYIEDLKSCDRKAFYHFNSNPSSFSEKIQVSAYRWLYFQIFGVEITRGVITKIDRENTRNRISLEVPMYSISYMDKFLDQHPSISSATGQKITAGRFVELTEIIIRKNRWVCKYCDISKDCDLNIKLTKLEKELKKKKKDQKAVFEKLIK